MSVDYELQRKTIDRFLRAALSALLLPTDEMLAMDKATLTRIHKAESAIMSAGCALEPRLYDKDERLDGFAALNGYLVKQGLERIDRDD